MYLGEKWDTIKRLLTNEGYRGLVYQIPETIFSLFLKYKCKNYIGLFIKFIS